MDFIFNPNFGNVTQAPGNGNFTGPLTFWYFHKIPNYEVKSSFMTATGIIILNSTIKPCDVKGMKRMMVLVDTVFGNLTKNSEEENLYKAFKMSCPLEIVFSSLSFSKHKLINLFSTGSTNSRRNAKIDPLASNCSVVFCQNRQISAKKFVCVIGERKANNFSNECDAISNHKCRGINSFLKINMIKVTLFLKFFLLWIFENMFSLPVVLREFILNKLRIQFLIIKQFSSQIQF